MLKIRKIRRIALNLGKLGEGTCPACGSQSVMSKTDGTHHCMDCGHEW